MPSSLYIHIPFCLKKCAYCDFYSIPVDEDMAARYARALARDIRSHAGGALNTVYIGGGTPSILADASLVIIFQAIGESFTLSSDAEVSIEANPGTIDRRKAEFLRSLGVNRISLGVQSFNDDELRLLGRAHTAGEAIDAALQIAEVFDNFSLDLIYAIPGQSEESLKRSLHQAIEIGPTHVSAYELTPEPGTPLIRSIYTGELVMPEDDEIADMASIVIDTFEAAGLARYEISNYARPGFECRHNLNYWLRGEYIGLGAGAHAFVNETREATVPNVQEYIELVEQGVRPLNESLAVLRNEAQKETIFLGFRLAQGIAISRLQEVLGHDIHRPGELFIRDGFMETDGKYLRLTRRGMMIYNTVVMNFMDELGL